MIIVQMHTVKDTIAQLNEIKHFNDQKFIKKGLLSEDI